MAIPQSAIIPDTIQAGIWIEADIVQAQNIQAACLASLASLAHFQNHYPNELLGMTIAFGADFWHSLNHANEGQELKNFVPLGNGLAPATQHDLMIHIQSLRHDINLNLALAVVDAFGKSVDIKNEVHGFRQLENRGLDGFVDGTENPTGDKLLHFGIIADDKPDAGGSYVMLQKYRHDLRKWNTYNTAAQEEAVARTKESDEELSGQMRVARSHLGRVDLKENGEGLKIVRRSLPFGLASGEHGLMFIAYSARLHNIDQQLRMMFGEIDGQTDLLLERLSTPVSGAYYFAPSIERLRHL